MTQNVSLKLMADLLSDLVPLIGWDMRPSFCTDIRQPIFRRIYMWEFEGRFQNKLDRFLKLTRDAGFHEYFKRLTYLVKVGMQLKEKRAQDKLGMSYITWGTGFYTFFAIWGVLLGGCVVVGLGEMWLSTRKV